MHRAQAKKQGIGMDIAINEIKKTEIKKEKIVRVHATYYKNYEVMKYDMLAMHWPQL